jgi:hypothetical protein
VTTPDQPDALTWFTNTDVEAARQRLADNRYGGPGDYHDLDREDIHEIIRIVLTATWQSAVAAGRCQATEGWDREWAVAHVDGGWVYPYESEAEARAHCRVDWHHVVSRLVGRWEPAEQTPERESGGFELLPEVPESSYPPDGVPLPVDLAEQEGDGRG